LQCQHIWNLIFANGFFQIRSCIFPFTIFIVLTKDWWEAFLLDQEVTDIRVALFLLYRWNVLWSEQKYSPFYSKKIFAICQGCMVEREKNSHIRYTWKLLARIWLIKSLRCGRFAWCSELQFTLQFIRLWIKSISLVIGIFFSRSMFQADSAGISGNGEKIASTLLCFSKLLA